MPTVDATAFREFERLTHDRIADSYHGFFVPITAHAAGPLLDAVMVRPAMRVLDIATGSGRVAGQATARGASVTAVDIAGRMIALAARLHPGCAFHQADAESLPFADSSFDAVTCAFGIGHFARPELAVSECVRVLKSAGRLALSWWNVPAHNRLQGVLLEAVEEAGVQPTEDLPAGPPIFRYSEDAELESLLKSAGLKQTIVTTHAFSYRIESAGLLWDGAMGSLARIPALLRGQSPETLKRVRAAFDRGLRAYTDEGGITLPMSFKLASGQKA